MGVAFAQACVDAMAAMHVGYRCMERLCGSPLGAEHCRCPNRIRPVLGIDVPVHGVSILRKAT